MGCTVLRKDALRMNDILTKTDREKDPLLLGTRSFEGSHVPLKSSFGNKLTSFLFGLLYGKKIHDTQTGLRGFTTHVLKYFLNVKGERFEYETSMLIRDRSSVVLHVIPTDSGNYGNPDSSCNSQVWGEANCPGRHS